jgi:DNA-directed RNA polymerase specialized sigma subunit
MEGIFFGTEGIYFSGNKEDDEANAKGPVKGIANSLKRSAKGRPSSLSQEKLDQLMEIYYTKPYSLRKIGQILGVSRMTVWRAVQQMTI